MRSDIADDQQSLHISQRGPVRSIRMRIDLCFFNGRLLSFPSRSCEAQELWVQYQKRTMLSVRYRSCCWFQRQTVSKHAATN